MWLEKLSKLLSFHGVCSRRYCFIEGEEAICHHTLPLAITEDGKMKSCDNLNKTGIVFTSTEFKDLEASSVGNLLDRLVDLNC